MIQFRKWLAAAMLALAATSGIAADTQPAPLDHLAEREVYMVVFQRGPGWDEAKPMREQEAMTEHFLYYLALHRAGQLVGGGRFSDDSGGSAVFLADSPDAARGLIASDPAVKAGTFVPQLLQRWHLNPWDEISRKRAAAGR